MAIVSQSELILQRREWKRNGKRVVCVAGAFDLLHPGHVRLLEQARGLGDVLVVALQSDASVRRSGEGGGTGEGTAATGGSRPITSAAERAEILTALAAVDYVVEFEEATPREFIARFTPDVVVKGGQAGLRESELRDDEDVKAAGGQAVRVPFEPGYSTSALIARITQLQA